jgi:predicted RNase H-like nuclease (RuvC/YqgF family)
MSDISSLENRITAALDRIRAGLDSRPAVDAVPSEALQAALDKERAANAELTQRMADLEQRQEGRLAALSGRVETQVAQLGALEAELQKLRAANLQLRDMNGKLRAAVTEGLTPEVHEASLAAEIASLEAQRAADAAEMDAIIAELKPLIAEG